MKATLQYELAGQWQISEPLLPRGMILPGRAGNPTSPKPGDLALRDKYRIFQRDGRWLLENHGPTPSTHLNSERVRAAVLLNDGDLIGCGSATVRFLHRQAPAADGPAAADVPAAPTMGEPETPVASMVDAIRGERDRALAQLRAEQEQLAACRLDKERLDAALRRLSELQDQLAESQTTLLEQSAAAANCEHQLRQRIIELETAGTTAARTHLREEALLRARLTNIERRLAELRRQYDVAQVTQSGTNTDLAALREVNQTLQKQLADSSYLIGCLEAEQAQCSREREHLAAVETAQAARLQTLSEQVRRLQHRLRDRDELLERTTCQVATLAALSGQLNVALHGLVRWHRDPAAPALRRLLNDANAGLASVTERIHALKSELHNGGAPATGSETLTHEEKTP